MADKAALPGTRRASEPATKTAGSASAPPAPPVWAADVDRRVRQGRNSAVVASTIVALVVAAMSVGLVLLLRQRTAEAFATPPVDGSITTPGGSLRVEYQEYQWERGGAPVRMIRKEEGFCYLTRVNGEFAGMGEQARVYIGDDGYWYLHGTAFKPLAATAMSVRFVSKPFASASVPGQETWDQTLARLEASDNAQLRELAKAEHDGPPEDPQTRVQLADLWESESLKVANTDRPALVAHALQLYAPTKDGGPVAANVNAKVFAILQSALNDLAQWKPQSGVWEATADGKIRGRGDSGLLFAHQLPRDCTLEFHMNVVEGMRPRIHFPGTDFYVGNEGYEHVIEPYGAVSSQGVSFPYFNNEEMKLDIKFSGEHFELRVNDKVTARGTRKTPPDHVGLRIEAGDGWSPGIVLFWGLRLTPELSS